MRRNMIPGKHIGDVDLDFANNTADFTAVNTHLAIRKHNRNTTCILLHDTRTFGFVAVTWRSALSDEALLSSYLGRQSRIRAA